MLIHIYDVNASDSKNMITFNQLAEKVHTLASYYGLGLVSYTSVMRDVIYGDGASEEMHPQFGVHVVSAWAVGYYLLSLVTTYCSLEPEMQANAAEVFRVARSLCKPQTF